MLVSCSDQEVLNVVDFSKPLTLRSSTTSYDFDKFNKEAENYWNCAIQSFGLDVICGCDCDAIETIPQIWDNCKNNLSEFVNDETISVYHCDTLKNLFTQSCDYQSYSEFVDSQIENIEDVDFISSHEILLIKNVLENLPSNGLNINDIRQSWYNLPASDTNNNFSLIFIEVSSSLLNFKNQNPDLFNDDKDDVQALWWKAAAIVGGAAGSLFYDVANDIITNEPGSYEFTTNEQLWQSAKKGAILGAFR